MISLDQALALLLDGVEPRMGEPIPLDALDGRILAEDIVAGHDQPAERRSLMDGIALAADAPGRFALIGESAAGAPFAGTLGEGQAIAIATGAVVPDGARQVVPKELVGGDDRTATVETWPSSRFIRSVGSDFRRGELLLRKGSRLDPSAVMLIAAANRDSAEVTSRPRVAILTGGDELVAPGQPLRPGQSIDSVGYGLAALCRSWGASVTRSHTDDLLDATIRSMRKALEDTDLLITVGGASVGTRDLMRPAAEALGAAMRFERINLQPGKPCWHARLPDGKMILGLPGNPSSAMVCAHLLVRPLLAAMTGAAERGLDMDAVLAGPLEANGPREQFFRAVRTSPPGAALELTPLDDQDSGLQAALAKATHLVRRPPNEPARPAGSTVSAIPLKD